MKDFGYSISKGRTLNYDNSDFSLKKTLEHDVVSYCRCIGCGACASTCSAAKFTDFSIFKCNMLFRNAKYDELEQELSKCTLCGKCTLVCPRGVNIRGMILEMRNLIEKNKNTNE